MKIENLEEICFYAKEIPGKEGIFCKGKPIKQGSEQDSYCVATKVYDKGSFGEKIKVDLNQIYGCDYKETIDEYKETIGEFKETTGEYFNRINQSTSKIVQNMNKALLKNKE